MAQPRIKDVNDIVGKQFNKLIVLRFSKFVEKRNARNELKRTYYYMCRCTDCKTEKEIIRGNLLNLTTVACGCNQNPYGKENNLWTGFEEISGSLWNEIKRNAKKRNIIFNITIEDAYNQYIKQNKKCNYTDIDLNLRTYFNKETDRTASLDRIDSTKGYEIDNIEWVFKDINMIKGKLSKNRFIELCSLVSNTDKNLQHEKLLVEPIIEYSNFQPIWNHSKMWKGIGYISSTMWSKIIKNAQNRNIPICITISDANKLYKQQNHCCAVTKILLNTKTTSKQKINITASLDRIDNSRGYEIDNIQWVLKEINMMKWTLSQDRFKELCKMVAIHCAKQIITPSN